MENVEPLKKTKRGQISAGGTALKILFITAIAALCFLMLFPVEWMIVSSFKTQDAINNDLSSFRTFLPGNITEWFTSYGLLFTNLKFFGNAVFNSVLYCVITIAGVLLINSFAGYALARFTFPGSKVISTVIILLIIVPVETSIVPLYVILYRLNLLKEQVRIVGYLIPGFASAFYIFMFRQFFLSIPRELEEAARIDGAGRLRAYFTIILPLSKAIIATVAIFTFMGAWNEYVFAQLLFSDPKQQPLQVFLQMVNNFNPKDISMVMASLTLSTVPIAIVYIFCQRFIVEGVSFSGLK